MKKNRKDNSRFDSLIRSRFVSSKRSQEEMVGFVLIIILVAVIALIFLAISLRRPGEVEVKSKEIENFIQASLYYTTTCQLSSGRVYNFEDIISACYKNEDEVCVNEKTVCEIMEETAIKLLDNSWIVGEQAPIKGYAFNITSPEKNMLSLDKGLQTGSIRGNQVNLPVLGENIEITLTLFY